MAALFLDTSALVRRYDRLEPGSQGVRAACAPSSGNTIVVGRLASVEVASALARKARDGTLSATNVTRLWNLFLAHWRLQYQVVALTDQVYARAEQLLFTHSLRAFDAVHIGCALVVASRLPRIELQFWTADKRQAQAASAEGVAVQFLS